MSNDRIERIELYHVNIPVPTPLFPTWIPGHAVTGFASTVLVVRTRDGLTGIASGPALAKERSGLGDFIGPFLLGLDPFDIDACRERLRQASYLGWRNNWMDVAFWDLAAQQQGIPVHELLARRLGAVAPDGADRPAGSVPVPGNVQAFATFQELRAHPARAEEIERALRLGFRGVLIGVHHETEDEDLKHIEVARKAAGSDAELYVHAHQAWSVSLVKTVPRWSFDRALRFVERAAELGYRRVQEPLHEEDWDGLEALRARARLPIAGGDLSVSASHLRYIARLGCYDVLTPAAGIAGLGRLEVAMQTALRFGLDFCPMSYGDGIELMAHLHATAAWARVRSSSGVRLAFPWEPPALMPEHRDALLTSPIHVDRRGCLAVPAQPGLGVGLDPGALKRYGELFYELTPVRLMVSSARRAGLRQTAEIALRPRSPARGKRRS